MNAAHSEIRPRPSDEVLATLSSKLAETFGERVVASPAIREQHGHTLTWVKNQPPDLVIYPRSTAEVSAIVKLCAAHDVPVVPFGTGTSLEGHVNAPSGGVSIDMSLMKRILAVHEEDLDCVVEAGVTRKELNEHLRDKGLFFPIDPGADASIGGMTATRASGTNAVRYGTMKDAVLCLTVVMPDGEIVKTASRARKSSAGYDLTRLLIGSEGTLGVITEITLKLHGIPEAISAGICPFPSVKAACDAVIMTIQTGIPVARIELLDEVQVRAVNLHSKLTLPESPLLLLEFHGSAGKCPGAGRALRRDRRRIFRRPFRLGDPPEDRSKLWQARHDAYWAARGLRPGANRWRPMSACRSRGSPNASMKRNGILRRGLIAPIVGHVGDGNFHVQPLVNIDDPRKSRPAKPLSIGLSASARHGGDLHGGTWRRSEEDEISRNRAWAGGARLMRILETGHRSATTS